MRSSRLVLAGLVGGALAWVVRERRDVARMVAATADDAARRIRGGSTRASQPASIDAPVSEPATPPPHDAAPDVVAVDDPSVLVDVEREFMTVAGDSDDEHRRRDQTAGVAAQEIAAAQVRGRRNGVDEDLELDAEGS